MSSRPIDQPFSNGPSPEVYPGMRIRQLVDITASVIVTILVAVACSDDPEPVVLDFKDTPALDGTPTTLIPPTPSDPPESPRPTLGTMEVPCGLVDLPTVVESAEVGIDDGSIVIATGNDRGGLFAAGSGRGIPDAVEVMAGYCNSLGGLAGRDVVVVEYDAAAVEVGDRTAEQCVEASSVVGHGYLHEEEAAQIRAICALPAYPSWVPGLLSGEPFPIHGHLLALFADPAAADVALIGPDTPAGVAARFLRGSALAAGVGSFSVVADIPYSVDRDPGWSTMAAQARDSGAGLVYVDGSCGIGIVPFLRAAAALDWTPIVLAGPSAYDPVCISDAAGEGLAVQQLLVELPFLPIEDGDKAPVTAAYATMLGEVAAPVTGDALLASSAFWRWAAAVDGCGSDLGRRCLAEAAVTGSGWTAGELHRSYDIDGLSEPCIVLMGVADGILERRLPEDPGTYDCDPERSVALRRIDG